jgi:hypothetical protein
MKPVELVVILSKVSEATRQEIGSHQSDQIELIGVTIEP